MQREPIDEPTTSIKKQKRRQQAEAERQRRPMNGQQRAETKSQWRAALQYPPFLVQRFVGWLVCLFCNRSAPFASGLHFSFVRLASLFFCLLLLFFFYPKATKCRRHFPSPPPRVSSTFFFLFPFSFFFFSLRSVFFCCVVFVFCFSSLTCFLSLFLRNWGQGSPPASCRATRNSAPPASASASASTAPNKSIEFGFQLGSKIFFFFKKRSFENNKMEWRSLFLQSGTVFFLSRVFLVTGFYLVSSGFTGSYRVLSVFTWFYRLLPGFYRVSSGLTGFYRVLTGFYRVSSGFTRSYRVLPSFTGFYLV